MKKLTGILVSLVALILIAYYALGFIVESSLKKNISAAPQISMLKVHLDQYQRGWFSSHAILAVTAHIPEHTSTDKNGVATKMPPVDFDLSFPLTINHGPIIFTDSGIRFGIGHITTRPETHYNVLINYFNQILYRYTFPAVAFKSRIGGQDFQFELLGVKALFGTSANLDKLNSDFILYGLSGAASKVVFKLGKVLHYSKLFRTQEGLWLGDSQLSISSINLNIADEKTFSLAGLDFGLNADNHAGVLNFKWDVSLDKLLVEDKAYGPGVLKLTIKNIDPAAMPLVNQQVSNILQKSQDPQLSMMAILYEMPKLLSKGAQLELEEMSFKVPEGKITGHFKIWVPKNNLTDPQLLLQKVLGEGQFKAPMSLVRELMVASITDSITKQAAKTAQAQSTPQQVAAAPVATPAPAPVAADVKTQAQQKADKTLQDMVSKGFLNVEGNDYVFNFKLENQQVTVNGQPFNPDMLP